MGKGKGKEERGDVFFLERPRLKISFRLVFSFLFILILCLLQFFFFLVYISMSKFCVR